MNTTTCQSPGAEHEVGILGSILLDATCVDVAVRAGVNASSFTFLAHSIIWCAIDALHAARHPIDLLSVAAKLRERGDLERCGGPAFLDGLVDQVPTAAHVAYHAQELVRLATLRKIGDAARSLADAAEAGADLAGPLGELDKARESKITTIETEDAGAVLAEPMPEVSPVLDGICEPGDLGDLISGSKDKKTWFAMAVGLHVASGKTFHGLQVARPVNVLYANLEVQPRHFRRRQHMIARAHGIPGAAVKGRFFALHGRAVNGETVLATLPELIRRHDAEFVILDCLYRLLPPGADENMARDLGPVMSRLLRLADETRAVFLVVHHDPKASTTGDRRLQDRGAGSNVASRANDFRVVLTRARDDEDAIVVEVLPRNFPPFPAFCVRFQDGGFMAADGVAPIAQTASDRARATAKANREPIETKAVEVLALLDAGPMDAGRFRSKVHRLVGTDARTREIIAMLESDGTLAALRERGRGLNRVTYGTPEQIEELRQRKLAI